MTDEIERPHISPSQIQTYTRCGEAWRRRYIDGDIRPPGIAAHVGTGVHAGASLNFAQKIDSHEDLAPSDIRDASVAAMQARVEEQGVHLTEDDGSLDKAVGKAIDKTAQLAVHHAIIVAPMYQPIMTEQAVTIPLPKRSHDILGVVDLIDDQQRVVDFKTTTRAKQQKEADESIQLTVYAAAAARLIGKVPESLVLDVSVYSEKAIAHTPLVTTRDQQDFQILANHVNVVVAGIQSGVFAPAPRGSWYCSAKWCGYHSSCKYVRK